MDSNAIKLDMTVTISAILGASAIIVPMLTTILNNFHQMRLRKFDAKQEAKKNSNAFKRDIYESYLKTTGRCISDPTSEHFAEYGDIYPVALIYFPDNLVAKLLALDSLISEKHWKEARATLNDLAPLIRDLVQTL